MANKQVYPGEDFSRYGGATSQFPKFELPDLHTTQSSNPDYPYTPNNSRHPTITPASAGAAGAVGTLPWCNPRGWSLRTKLIVGGVTVAVIVGVVVGAVVGTRRNRYPDYTPLKYRLVDDYSGTGFFDKFDYFSAQDPTDGFVQYVDQPTAQSLNLTHATDESVVLKVDTSNPYAASGRQSVRIESKSHYNDGLFVFDITHTPYGCGLWPALWLTDGYNWPTNGEIDVVETNNLATEGNVVTLHSTAGCNMKVKRKQTGIPNFLTCDNSTHGNAGCGVQAEPQSYGEWLNALGGGVYTLELREAGVRAWFFARDSIPDDISNSTPDPSTWGTALADFPSTNCDIPSHFTNQSIIVNIDLCGQLGAQPQYYTEQYHCPGTCENFVAHNPGNFTQAYWEFKSFKVYQAE